MLAQQDAAAPNGSAPSEITGDFKRERRYTVLKNADIGKYLDSADTSLLVSLCDKVTMGRLRDGKPPMQCVVVEHDWPEFEPTWNAITERSGMLYRKE